MRICIVATKLRVVLSLICVIIEKTTSNSNNKAEKIFFPNNAKSTSLKWTQNIKEKRIKILTRCAHWNLIKRHRRVSYDVISLQTNWWTWNRSYSARLYTGYYSSLSATNGKTHWYIQPIESLMYNTTQWLNYLITLWLKYLALKSIDLSATQKSPSSTTQLTQVLHNRVTSAQQNWVSQG